MTVRRGAVIPLVAWLTLIGCSREHGSSGGDRQTPPPGAKGEAASGTQRLGAEAPLARQSFRLEQAGWRFDIDTAASSRGTRVDVLVRTATVDAPPGRWTLMLDDPITDAFATDLDGDAAPELLFWTRSTGSSAEGGIHGWRFAANGTADALTLPALEDDLAIGWRGRDQFGVQGGHLVRSFPLYREGDDNAQPNAGFVRVIHYRLAGTGWRVDDSRLEPMDGTPQATVLSP